MLLILEIREVDYLLLFSLAQQISVAQLFALQHELLIWTFI